jgi:O-antigen/teichoic acid export membrane protein
VFRGTLDRLIIGVVVGFTGAGMYFAAYQIANVLTLVCSAINQAWTPWLFKRLASGRMEDRREVVRVTYAVLALYFAAAAALMIAGPILLPILVGEQFRDAGKLLLVLAPAAAFNGGYLLFTNYIFYAERTKWLPIITGFNALLQALATYVLVHKYNVWGAAFATLGGGALYMVCIWIAAARLVPMGWFSLLKRTPSA